MVKSSTDQCMQPVGYICQCVCARARVCEFFIKIGFLTLFYVHVTLCVYVYVALYNVKVWRITVLPKKVEGCYLESIVSWGFAFQMNYSRLSNSRSSHLCKRTPEGNRFICKRTIYPSLFTLDSVMDGRSLFV